MKIFISQPMSDKSREDILAERKRIEEIFKGNEFIDTFIEDVPEMTGSTRLWCLGESIKRMKDANLVVVPSNSYNYAGCDIEAQVACMYGIPMCRIQMYPHQEEDRYSYANCEAVCEAR